MTAVATMRTPVYVEGIYIRLYRQSKVVFSDFQSCIKIPSSGNCVNSEAPRPPIGSRIALGRLSIATFAAATATRPSCQFTLDIHGLLHALRIRVIIAPPCRNPSKPPTAPTPPPLRNPPHHPPSWTPCTTTGATPSPSCLAA